MSKANSGAGDSAAPFLTKQQLAERWHLSPRTINAMIERGELAIFRPAKAPLIPLVEVVAFEEKKVTRAGKPEGGFAVSRKARIGGGSVQRSVAA